MPLVNALPLAAFEPTGIVRDGKEHPARFHRKGVVRSL